MIVRYSCLQFWDIFGEACEFGTDQDEILLYAQEYFLQLGLGDESPCEPHGRTRFVNHPVCFGAGRVLRHPMAEHQACCAFVAFLVERVHFLGLLLNESRRKIRLSSGSRDAHRFDSFGSVCVNGGKCAEFTHTTIVMNILYHFVLIRVKNKLAWWSTFWGSGFILVALS